MGAYLPERVVANRDLTQFLDTSDEWIVQRSGIHERRFAAPGEGTASMGAEAARRAVADASWSLADVEFVIFATLSPDHFFPGPGCYMQALLGMPNVGALDIRNQCSGFLYGLSVANALIAAGEYSRVLLVGSEKHSAVLEVPNSPRHIAVLFGDAAAAVALEATEADGVIATVLHADGHGADALKLELFDFRKTPFITEDDLHQGRQLPVMDGRQVFTSAIDCMAGAAQETLTKAGRSLADVDLVIPHQANLRISEAVRKRLELAPEKIFNNIHNRGNTTAASIPLAMVEAREQGILRRGQLLLLLAFGSGFTWGGSLLRF
jgi:3-oxoacyl-[acyl-carrier-protein] synthase-3